MATNHPNAAPPTAVAIPTPTLKKEYLDMIPEYSGEPTLLNRFISICDKLDAKFFVKSNPADFQNEYLYSTIIAKIKSPALDLVTSSNSYAWPEVRQVLLNSYMDKRDCFTLNLEMAELKQETGESPFSFFERIQKLLNLQISYFRNKEIDPASKVMCEYVNKLALRVLLRGLREPLGSLMRTKNPDSLDNALHMLSNDFQFKISYYPENTNLKKTMHPQNQHKHQLNPPMQYYPQRNQSFYQNQNPKYQNFQNKNQFNNNSQYSGTMYRGQQNFSNNQPKPQHFNSNNQPRTQGFNNNQPRPQNNYQPTPMSISSINNRPQKRPRLYQLTGRPIEETQTNDFDNNFNDDPQNELENQFEQLNFENRNETFYETNESTETDPFLEEMSLERNFQL